MPIRTLLLHVDATGAYPDREATALRLARDHGAHVHALYCVGEFYVPGWADWPPHVLEEQREQEQQRAEQCLARLRDQAERMGVGHSTRAVRIPTEGIAEEVAIHARHCDAAVLGQPNPDEPTAPDSRSLVEHVVLGAGRPILVVPYIGLPRDAQGNVLLGRHALVAWDAGREATRAINDALALLERADHVDLVTIDAVKRPDRHGELPGADMATHLARHGIAVDVHLLESHGLSTADVLLNQVADRGSDLVVMGGYGHSRLREFILGGATRTVLEQMSVPVLMSH